MSSSESLSGAPRARLPSPALTRGWRGLWVLGPIALLFLYPLGASDYDVFLLATALTYGILAMSLDLQWGYGGLINFGPAAYFGIGAYGYALLTLEVQGFGSAYAAVPAAVIVTTLFAVALSYPAFRGRVLMLYYALLTLAAALLLGQYATIAYDFTGGSDGLTGIPPLDLSIPGLVDFDTFEYRDAYYVVLVTCAVVFALLLWVVSSPFGRVVRAVRADEVKCESLGYNTVRYKLAVAALGGAVGGLSGALYAGVSGNIDPSIFGVALSVQVFVWVAIGGQGSLWGPLLAAILLRLAESYFSAVTTDLYLIIVAAIFVIAVIVLPEGIAGGAARLARRSSAAPARGR